MKSRNIFFIFLITGTVLFYSGCRRFPCITGNDIVITETRNIEPFHKISSEGWFDVYVVQDSINKIIVEAESNLMPFIETIVRGSTLVIREYNNQCINNNYPVRVTVYCNDLSEITLSGSGDITGNTMFVSNYMGIDLSGSGNIFFDITAPVIETTLSGSGTIDLEVFTDYLEGNISGSGDTRLIGEVNRTDLNISGSGNIHAYGLVQNKCFSTISGSGDMYLFVNSLLDVNISGSGSVFYKGNPDLFINITGSGSVVHQP